MDKLMIVEDDAMIRKGLRSMAERSNVPIADILECESGEDALEILKSVQVDVLFTDVQMPGLGGLELLGTLSDIPEEKRPQVVVISGHDNFDYAVQALRYGAEEYMLKPVKRACVAEVLRKLDDGIAERNKALRLRSSLVQQQLKYILLNTEITPEEIETVSASFDEMLTEGEYRVVCSSKRVDAESLADAVLLDVAGPYMVLLYTGGDVAGLVAGMPAGACVGVSGPRNDLAGLQDAYEEAKAKSRHAFYFGDSGPRRGSGRLPAPVDPAGPELLASLVGTGRYAHVTAVLEQYFSAVSGTSISVEVFEAFLTTFLQAVEQNCEGSAADGWLAENRLPEPYAFESVNAYYVKLRECLDELNQRLYAGIKKTHYARQMEQAFSYIEANYANKNLNMAVVSNNVSMNYSVFSQLFKEHAGINFNEYVRALKLENAKNLLVETDLKISDISDQMGFKSEKYFMKIFKESVGISPTQYRLSEKLRQKQRE